MKSFFIRYGVTTAVAAVIAVLVMLVRGTFVATTALDVYKGLSDGFFVSGILIAGYGLIVVSSNGGTFDIFAYGIGCVFSVFQRQSKRSARKSFYEYRKAKQEKKRGFFYLVIVGCLFVAVGAVFSIVFSSIYV